MFSPPTDLAPLDHFPTQLLQLSLESNPPSPLSEAESKEAKSALPTLTIGQPPSNLLPRRSFQPSSLTLLICQEQLTESTTLRSSIETTDCSILDFRGSRAGGWDEEEEVLSGGSDQRRISSSRKLFQHQEILDRGQNPLIIWIHLRLPPRLANSQPSQQPTSLNPSLPLPLNSPKTTSSPPKPGKLDLHPTTPPLASHPPTLPHPTSCLPTYRNTERGIDTRSRGRKANSPSDQLGQRIFELSIDLRPLEASSPSLELYEIRRFTVVGTSRIREGCRGVRE